MLAYDDISRSCLGNTHMRIKHMQSTVPLKSIFKLDNFKKMNEIIKKQNEHTGCRNQRHRSEYKIENYL